MGQGPSEHGGFPCPPQKGLHTGSSVGSQSGINSGSHSEPHAESYLDSQTGYQTGSLRGPRKGSETEVNGSMNLEGLRDFLPLQDAFEKGQIFNRFLWEVNSEGGDAGTSIRGDALLTTDNKFMCTSVIPSLEELSCDIDCDLSRKELNCDIGNCLTSCESNILNGSQLALPDLELSEISNKVNEVCVEEVALCKNNVDLESVKALNSDALGPSEEKGVVKKKKRMRYRKKTDIKMVNGMHLEPNDSTSNTGERLISLDCDITSNENTPKDVNESVDQVFAEGTETCNYINIDKGDEPLVNKELPKSKESDTNSVPVSAQINDTKLVSSSNDNSPSSNSITTTSFQSFSSDYTSCESISKPVEDVSMHENTFPSKIDMPEKSPIIEDNFHTRENSCNALNSIKLPTTDIEAVNYLVCDTLEDTSLKKDNLLANSTSKFDEPIIPMSVNSQSFECIVPSCDHDNGVNVVSSSIQTSESLVSNIKQINLLNETKTNDKTSEVSPKIEYELLGPFPACIIKIFPRSAVAAFDLHGVSTSAFFFFKDLDGTKQPVGSWVILEKLLHVNSTVYGTTLHAKVVSLVHSEASKTLSGVANEVKNTKSVANIYTNSESSPLQQKNSSTNNVPTSANNNEISSKNEVESSIPVNINKTNDKTNIVSPETEYELLGPFPACIIKIFPRSAVASFDLHGVSTCAFFFFKDLNGNKHSVGSWVILEKLLHMNPCANSAVYGTTLHAKVVSLMRSKTSKTLNGLANEVKNPTPVANMNTNSESAPPQQANISIKSVPISANNCDTIASKNEVKSSIPININKTNDALPVCAQPLKSVDEGLIGSCLAIVVEKFPKSAVAGLCINGIFTRIFFFSKNVLDAYIPEIGTTVILEDVSRKFADNFQFVSLYKSMFFAETVSVVVSREIISGRTGPIVKYFTRNCGVLELNHANNKFLATFTAAEVNGVNIGKYSLEEFLPVGSPVHFQGELVKSIEKKVFIVSSIWPQGSQKSIHPQTNNVDPPTKVTNSNTKIKKVYAHTGRVSKYVSNVKGVIEFRLEELYLNTEFKRSLCTGLVSEESLSEQWPPGTVVHFDGVLSTSSNDPQFCVSRVWSKKRVIHTPVLKILPELSPGPHLGTVTELRPPGAFVVSIPQLSQKVNVFVFSMYFRKSREEPRLRKMVSVDGLLSVGQHVFVCIKPSSPDNKKDCDYVATDAWPATEVSSDSTSILTQKPLNENLSSLKPGNQNPNSGSAPVSTVKVQSPLYSHIAKNLQVSSKLKSSAHEEPRNTEPAPITKQLGLPSSAAKALAARLGPARQCCVVRATPEAVLFRVQFSGVTSQAAALAPTIQLCGVPLDGVDLTLVLAPGQELDVHLLPEDEKHILSTDTCSTSNLTLSWQNHFYVAVLWLGRAHLETSSNQIAELTNFCLHHKVPNTVRHKLTHRLGQILEKDGRKKIIISSDEDDFGETAENQKKKSIKKKNDCKNTPQLSNPSIEKAVVEKLKDLGPENFLRSQLKQLIHSALKESVHAAQEFFLSSLKEHCGSTPIYTKLAAETPDMVESAIQEYFLEKQKKAEGSLRFVATPAQPGNGAGDACADGVSVGAQTARAAAAAAAAEAAAAAAAAAAARTVNTNTNTNTNTSTTTSTTVAPSSLVTPQVAACLANEGKRALEKDGARAGDDDGVCRASKVLERAVAVQELLQHSKEGLQATTQTYSAMQEPVKKRSKIDVVDKLTEDSNLSADAPSESSPETQEPLSLDAADTEKGEPDTRDFQKTLSAELQKHARELALFRDEACSLIENWKSADSPPATPEELEFLQELSLLLENRVEGGGKTGKNEEDTSVVAQQLIKFWNTANFPLTPVAQRGLQRLQELFGVPDKKMEGSEKDCLGSSGDGLVEVEAALKEVRDAFRDVKHVFEVQRCFRDLRECFRDVRRAYRGREPRPRALPPCADAPAAAAAVAALAEAVVQVKKRGRNIPGVTGSRTPSPTQTSPQAQGRKKPQLLCPTCKAGIPSCTSGDDTTSPTNDSTISSAQSNLAENSKIEVCSSSSQTTTSMETPLSRGPSPATSDQSAQTISTGAVLALHLLPDQ